MATKNQYPPGAEAKLILAVNQFHDTAATDPVGFFTTSAAIATLGSKASDFVTKYNICQDPNTRTKPALELKQVSKLDLLAYFRPLFRSVTNALGMTNAKRAQLGFPLHADSRVPVTAPTDAPTWEVLAMNGWMAKFRVRPYGYDGRSAKAENAIQLHVYSAIGATPPTNLNDWKFEGSPSRAIFSIAFDASLAVGTRVYVCFCWTTARGLTSPACSPIPLLIGGGIPDVTAG
jgi:hypothetical protein